MTFIELLDKHPYASLFAFYIVAQLVLDIVGCFRKTT